MLQELWFTQFLGNVKGGRASYGSWGSRQGQGREPVPRVEGGAGGVATIARDPW